MPAPILNFERVPAQDRPSRRLMVVLHGLGDSMDRYRWLPQAMRLAWMLDLVVNAPDDYYGGFFGFGFAGERVAGIELSRALLFKLLDAQRHEGFPTDVTTLVGFSQGCLMAWELGFHYPHRFAGLV